MLTGIRAARSVRQRTFHERDGDLDFLSRREKADSTVIGPHSCFSIGDVYPAAASVIQENDMSLRSLALCWVALSLVLPGLPPILAQSTAPAPHQSLQGRFDSVNRKVLEMAKDFPEARYDYRLKPEMRSFGELIVHIASGNVYAAKAGRGEKISWDDLDPKDYKTKAAIVTLMEKSIAEADATLQSVPDDALAKSIEPWLDVTEHAGEHYGLLVAYYRANGLVPPDSRPKK
jgi:hypothetical protein